MNNGILIGMIDDKKILILRISLGFLALVTVLLVSPRSLWAKDLKTIDGLNFQVPKDWPIEKRGGIVAPIPIEEYITIKFKNVEDELQSIRSEFLSKFDELTAGMKDFEEIALQEGQDQRVQEVPEEEVDQDLSEALSRLGLLESELTRLDRKITNKVSVMKGQFENVSQQARLIEEQMKGLKDLIQKLDDDIDYIFERQGRSY